MNYKMHKYSFHPGFNSERNIHTKESQKLSTGRLLYAQIVLITKG